MMILISFVICGHRRPSVDGGGVQHDENIRHFPFHHLRKLQSSRSLYPLKPALRRGTRRAFLVRGWRQCASIEVEWGLKDRPE
jgi:hypothetical protein